MTNDEFWDALTERPEDHQLYRMYADFLIERETSQENRLAYGLIWLVDNGKYPRHSRDGCFDWWTDYHGLLRRMEDNPGRRVTFLSYDEVFRSDRDSGSSDPESCKLPLCRLRDTYGWFNTAGLAAASVIARGAIAVAIDVLEMVITDEDLRSPYGSTTGNFGQVHGFEE